MRGEGRWPLAAHRFKTAKTKARGQKSHSKSPTTTKINERTKNKNTELECRQIGPFFRGSTGDRPSSHGRKKDARRAQLGKKRNGIKLKETLIHARGRAEPRRTTNQCVLDDLGKKFLQQKTS